MPLGAVHLIKFIKSKSKCNHFTFQGKKTNNQIKKKTTTNQPKTPSSWGASNSNSVSSDSPFTRSLGWGDLTDLCPAWFMKVINVFWLKKPISYFSSLVLKYVDDIKEIHPQYTDWYICTYTLNILVPSVKHLLSEQVKQLKSCFQPHLGTTNTSPDTIQFSNQKEGGKKKLKKKNQH